MVTVRVELFHEAIEDELKHEPDKRAQAVAVRLRNLEVEAHRRFAVDEIADAEIGTRNGLLHDWIVVQRHRRDDARLNARCLAVGAIELPLDGLAHIGMSECRLAVMIEPVQARARICRRAYGRSSASRPAHR